MSCQLSVIVPVYNVEKYLRKTVDSILNQSFKDIEIILVDDRSPDASPVICDEYAVLYDNVKVVHKPNNEGLGMACNTGISVASGQYIAFCDSDDWVEKSMYQTMLLVAEKYEADAVYTGLKRVDENGEFLDYMYHPSTFQQYKTKKQLQNLALEMISAQPADREIRHIQVSAKAVMYSKEVIDRNELKFVSERIIPSEDQCFNLSFILKSKSICVIPEFFYNYRINPNSITLKVREDLFVKMKALCEYTKNLCEGNCLPNYQNRLNRMLIDYSRNHIYNICQSSLPYSRKRQLVNEICQDTIWKEIWKSYPLSQSWWKHRIFSYAMRFNCFHAIYILTKN